jgi:putative addiction module component (TIGR02574 family)
MTITLQQFGIDRLTTEERLELIGLIWDSLEETALLPIPEWHLQELERRRAAAEANPGVGTPWEVVLARLRKPS